MDLAINGRRALVTGASKGIGFACAQRLAQEGCNVHLVARTEEDLRAAQGKIRAQLSKQVSNQESSNVNVTFTAVDLSDSADVDTLCNALGDVDIVVNNAGAIPPGSILDIDEFTWREAWDLKVFGYINICRRMYALMKERARDGGDSAGGVIINVIGAGGERPSAAYAAGAGGNAALMALTRALGGTSRKDNIRVVGVNPGQIVTERLETMQRTMAEQRWGDPERWQELWDARYPPGQPEHIADMVAFLASERSANTTGTIITIDGGHCAR